MVQTNYTLWFVVVVSCDECFEMRERGIGSFRYIPRGRAEGRLGGNPKQAAARAGLSLSVYLIKWTLCASY